MSSKAQRSAASRASVEPQKKLFTPPRVEQHAKLNELTGQSGYSPAPPTFGA
jgi:hypothetical protein